MRAVIQRVHRAGVFVEEREIATIGPGLLVLLGVHRDDSDDDVHWMVDKVLNLRIFADDEGKMNRSLLDTRGQLLVVSQFTLLGDCRKGRRPSWNSAAPPDRAEALYNLFVRRCAARNVVTKQGIFQAMMDISLVNNGPVTLLLDSQKTF